MNKKQFTNSTVETAFNNVSTFAQATYAAPHIEIIDIELEQNILGGSVPDMPPTPWT